MDRFRVVCLLLAFATARCASPVAVVGTTPTMDGRTRLVRLSYQRPPAYGPTGRPAGFEVIANYRSEETITEYEGAWNDESQTLTASISLPIGSDNLVYVIDSAVPLGLPTAINVSREGRLQPIACTQAVTTMQVCYELTVVGGVHE